MAFGRVLDPPRDLHPQSRLMESLADQRQRITAQERSTSSIRTAFPFAPGWSDYGAGQAPCSYYMDRGRVYFEGLAACATTNGLIGTLPQGFRPTTGTIIISTVSSLAGNLRIDINTSGNIVASTAASGHWVSLGDLSFRV